jgi:hypothetical protein
MDASSNNVPAALNYAPAGSARRVQYSNLGGQWTVTIPAPAGRRLVAAFSSALQILLAVFLNELGFWVVGLAAVGWWLGGADYRLLMILAGGVGFLGGVLMLEGWFRYRRLDGPVVVEVTPDTLSFLNLSAQRENHILPRNLVYDVKYVTHSRMMVVRTRGLEMFEWRPVDDDAEIARMVGFLRDALGLPAEGRTA